MNRKLVGVIAIVALLAAGAGVYKFVSAKLFERSQVQSSDAKVSLTMKVAGDSYQGYFFANSPEMKRQTLRRGLAVDYTNDGGAYAQRLEKFAKGEYDAIVLPVNSYIQHGQKYNYPGVIVSAIAESKGADAILCFANKVPSGKISDLNDASLRIVYTAESPSSFLLDLTIKDFDLDNLKRTTTWQQQVGSSEEVYKRAKAHDGDCFVMWEPDVQHALRDVPGLKKVWGSDGFSGYIVDVFVFRRDFISKHPDEVVQFFNSYFSTLRFYKNDRDKLLADMGDWANMKRDEVEAVLKEIYWYDLQENASRQFGLNIGVGNTAVEGVLNTILASTNVLISSGTFAKDPLGDPYKIINGSILQQVLQTLPPEVGKNSTARTFTALSDDEWKQLREVGVMRVEPIMFQSGAPTFIAGGEAQVDKIAEILVNNYPDYRVVIRGHTARGSDEQANVQLSRDRAEAVMQRLIAVHGLSADRLRAEGMGSSQPPQRKPGENDRQFSYRVPRVEFILFADKGSF